MFQKYGHSVMHEEVHMHACNYVQEKRCVHVGDKANGFRHMDPTLIVYWKHCLWLLLIGSVLYLFMWI